MRTTIRLPDQLYREVRRRAADEKRTVTSFIEESLRDRLAARLEHEATARFTVDAFVGTGTLPGVDLTNSAALIDHMEQ
jgi:Ribbon-helix-helix protein, copG family.